MRRNNMRVFTMGFTKKNAELFFKKIEDNKIQILIDVRLNNHSQLAGFTKEKDLTYFLKKICFCEYIHMVEYAPTKEILDDYKKGKIDWAGYKESFLQLIGRRHIEETFVKNFSKYDRVLLLCSEPTPENCHRRLVAEYLKDKTGCELIHL
jgi:hypothetical protein